MIFQIITSETLCSNNSDAVRPIGDGLELFCGSHLEKTLSCAESATGRKFVLQGHFMLAVRDPLVSEFETKAQETAHTAWLRAELEKRSQQPQELIAHDQVMAEMRRLIVSKNSA